MKNMKLLLTGALLVVTSACGTAKVSTIPGMDVSTKLTRKDYVILGTATGQACAEESCFLGSCTPKAAVAGEELLDGRAESADISRVRTAQLDLGPLNFIFGAGQTRGPSGTQIASKIALYKAIESIPDADAMLSPRYETDTQVNAIPLISKTVKSCVTVKGKAVRVKTDAELASGK